MRDNGLTRKTRPVRIQDPINRRALLTIVFLSVFLALTAWLAVPVLMQTALAAPRYRAAASGRAGVALLLIPDQAAAAGYGFLRDALATAGYDSYLYPLPAAANRGQAFSDTDAVDQASVKQAIAETIRLSGYPADSVWVVADPQIAAAVFAGMNPADAGGLVLIAPQTWPDAATALQAEWTDSGKLLILTAQKQNGSAHRFFELLTGEDATLFAGSQQAQGWGDRVFQSIDGRVSLVLFANLVEDWALISPSVLAELAARLREQSEAASPSTAIAIGALAAGQTATGLYRLFLSLAFLLAMPFAAGLLSGQNGSPADLPARQTGKSVQLVFWLAAALVAATAAWLLQHLQPSGYSWTAWFVLLTPGLHGWIAAAWHVFVLRPGQRQKPAGSRLLPAPAGVPAAILLPVLLTLTLLPFPGFWLSDRYIVLILLMAVNLAVGSNAAAGSCLISKGPWFMLPPVLLLLSGPAAGLVALLIVLSAFWSERCGRLVVSICRSHWLARLIQAACHTLLIFPLARLL